MSVIGIMKKVPLTLIALCGFALIAAVVFVDFRNEASPQSQGSSSVTTSVVRVVDGDTVVVKDVEGQLEPTSQEGHTVRLLGLDAPEMHPEGSSEPACGAQDASSRLARLLQEGQAVTLVWDSRSDRTDRYGRSLAYLELTTNSGRVDVGAELVSEGFVAAWYPRNEPRPERFSDYQDMQKQAHDRGSWPVCGHLGR